MDIYIDVGLFLLTWTVICVSIVVHYNRSKNARASVMLKHQFNSPQLTPNSKHRLLKPPYCHAKCARIWRVSARVSSSLLPSQSRVQKMFWRP